MYTIQALWTQAREGLDVTTIIFANRSYAILNFELARVGAEARGPAGARAARPRPARTSTSSRWRRAWASRAARADDARGLVAALREALAEPGPHLIEAVV